MINVSTGLPEFTTSHISFMKSEQYLAFIECNLPWFYCWIRDVHFGSKYGVYPIILSSVLGWAEWLSRMRRILKSSSKSTKVQCVCKIVFNKRGDKPSIVAKTVVRLYFLQFWTEASSFYKLFKVIFGLLFLSAQHFTQFNFLQVYNP